MRVTNYLLTGMILQAVGSGDPFSLNTNLGCPAIGSWSVHDCDRKLVDFTYLGNVSNLLI